MKRFLALLITSVFVMPAFASCSLDKPCTASVLNNNVSLQDKYAPNPLDEIKKTDAFQPRYKQPYYDSLINTTPASQSPGANSDYNSNCQFGVCLPGVEPSQGEFLE